MNASALVTSRPAAFLPHKQAVRQARRSSVKVMANFHSLSAKTLDGEPVLQQAVATASYVVSMVGEVCSAFAHPLASLSRHVCLPQLIKQTVMRQGTSLHVER
jgi:hypothetical protein